MKFQDYKYERPNFEEASKKGLELVEAFKAAESLEEGDRIFNEINDMKKNIYTMVNLCYIRHSIDTRDSFYEGEQNYFDETLPRFQAVESAISKALVESPHRKGLEEKYGKQLFNLLEMELKSFDEAIVEDLIEENKLVSQYSKLIASAKVEFEGEVRNLSQLSPFRESSDRDMRKKADQAYFGFYEEHEEEFDLIYDKLVKVRDRMAKKLGFENFVPLGYLRMSRSDYDAKDVKNYRDQVLREVVPVVEGLKERQKKRLGLENLKYYDEVFKFNSGNPAPKGDPDWIVENGKKMYEELSEETKEFFNFMLDRELLDLVSKEGKMTGGYCTFIDDYKSPFIFSNFNGTSGDIDVLTHEAGHAFQTYRSRHLGIPEYSFPTSEAAEIHSMSMEFITWPWMELFFEEDADKYRFSHLAGALSFLPYGVSVDEFQHFVYENPEASPAERKAKWREIEAKYAPSKDYDDNDFLDRGTLWFRQIHIYQSPFYYIDYTLAQVCALQFANKLNENRDQAWEDYLKICNIGGSKSFLGILEEGSLENPFEDGTIKKTMDPLRQWLDSVDDSKF